MKKLVILVALVSILGGFSSFAQTTDGFSMHACVMDFMSCSDDCINRVDCFEPCIGDLNSCQNSLMPYGRTFLFSDWFFVEPGDKEVYNYEFYSSVQGTFYLHFYNGNPVTGDMKVSTASVYLNGIEVVKENNLNQNVEVFVIPVTIEENNALTIEPGNPGMFNVAIHDTDLTQ